MTNTFYANIEQRIKSKIIKAVTFDFFDTLFSRRVVRPSDIFWILGTRLVAQRLLRFDVSAERFVDLRKMAEQRAREAGKSTEIGIEDIYRQFPKGFFSCAISRIVTMELAVEDEFLFPVDHVVDLLRLALKRGKTVAVVSDTYLSEVHLRKLAGDVLADPRIQVFVSSEYGAGKYDTLFQHVLKKLKVPAESVLHLGDHTYSDVERPASLGIDAQLLPHGSHSFWQMFNQEVDENNYYRERLDPTVGDMGITALRSKAMHFLSMDQADTMGYVKYGATILGPVVTSFVHWVRGVLKDQGIRTVLPLMRDGYLFDRLLANYNDDAVLSRPAYLSRRLLFQATLTDVNPESLRVLRFGNLHCTVSDYLSMLGLRITDIPAMRTRKNALISDDAIFDELLRNVTGNPALVCRIEQKASQIRQGIVSHVRGLITVDGRIEERVAVLDVGWNGTIQKLLERILSEEGIETELLGLYMMTTPSVNALVFDDVQAVGYFVDGGYPLDDYVALSRTLEVVEQSCSPQHGSTAGHDPRTGDPILLADKIPLQQRGDIADMQEGVELFQSLFLANMPKETTARDMAKLKTCLRVILRRAMAGPTLDEVNLFRDWVHDDNLASQGTMPIIGTGVSRDFAKHKTLEQHLGAHMGDVYWPMGALTAADLERAHLASAVFRKNIPTSAFSVNLNLASELAADSGHGFQLGRKNHQTIFQNQAGFTYLKFELDCADVQQLRWTVAAKPVELFVDHMCFSFQSFSTGHRTVQVLDGEQLGNTVDLFNIAATPRGGFITCGVISAFDFCSPRLLGIAGEGKLTLEIACRVLPIETSEPDAERYAAPMYRLQTGSRDGRISPCMGAIETLNEEGVDAKEEKDWVVPSSKSVSITGWLANMERKRASDATYLRVTNHLGESLFFKADHHDRPDVAQHLKEPNLVKSGFSTAIQSGVLTPGRYRISVLQEFQDGYGFLKQSVPVQIV